MVRKQLPKVFEEDAPSSKAPPVTIIAGQLTGWAAMAEIVRKYDAEKIEDCKDDIDTLLVFVSNERHNQ